MREGNDPAKQITDFAKNSRALSFNSDKTKAVYLCGSDEVRLLDLKTMQSSQIVNDEIWGFENSTPTFSPDDKYVMYTAYRNFEQDIFLYRLNDEQIFNITNTGVTESDPYWSPDGKYIYFASDRTHPSYPYGPTNQKLFRLPLEKITEPYRSDMFDSLFVKKKTDTEKTDTSAKEKKKEYAKKQQIKKEHETDKSTAAPKPEVSIDFNNMMERIEQIGPDFGQQQNIAVIKKR